MAKTKKLNATDVKKEKKTIEQTKEEKEDASGNFEGKLKKHIEEPLFVIAIAAVLLSIIKPSLDFAPLSYVILILGLISVYFVYIYFKNNVKNYYFIGIPVLIFFMSRIRTTFSLPSFTPFDSTQPTRKVLIQLD